MSQIPGFQESLPFNGALSTRIPLMTFSQGWPTEGMPNSDPRNANDLDDSFTDDWSWLLGKHFLQAGITVVSETKRQIPTTASQGNWTFTGTFTGNAMADFLLGDSASFTSDQHHRPSLYPRENRFAVCRRSNTS